MRALLSFNHRFIPLAKKLMASDFELVTMHPNFTKMLNDLDIPAKSLVEFAGNTAEAFMYSAQVVGSLPPIPDDIGLSPNVTKFAQQEIGGYLFQRLADVSVLVIALNNCKPDIIILHNDVEPINRVAALWGRANKIPVLHVPHAVYMIHKERTEIGTDIHDLISATHLAASGEFQKQWYVDRGFPTENIRITGLPQFDNFALVAPDRNRACQLFGLNPNRPVITYASSWRQDTNLLGCHDGIEEWYDKILDAAQGLQGAQFVIKVHPNGRNLEYHVKHAEERGANVVVTATHLETLLQATDALIAYGPSNILLEGAFLPNVRLMATHGYDNDVEVIKLGENASSQDVALAIKQVLAVPPLEAGGFLQKYVGYRDGKNTDRIMQFVLELMT